MPSLDQLVVNDLQERLARHLQKCGGYSQPAFLCAGGSAAVFRVDGPNGVRAFKAFEPNLLSGLSGAAERRRLDIQRRLIGHTCPSLIQTFRVEEAEGTAIVEMEFVAWPQLGACLSIIPDEAVIPLFSQLVDSVRYLESLNIVHRDIKPENIHVSDDFGELKLLDLGVAREFELADDDAAITDNANSRPFLATAQYSSPEYLFRLDEPTKRLWSGLNFYQLGAVLHDLIMKKPLFDHEMKLSNRWLVAKAVLTQTPSFSDPIPNRLMQAKAIAARCLVKNLDTRLQIVGWDDFQFEKGPRPLSALRGRLKKGSVSAGSHATAAAHSKLEFERAEYLTRVTNQVRTELTSTCGKQLPFSTRTPGPGELPAIRFEFAHDSQASITCNVGFEWLNEPYERSTNITLSAHLFRATGETPITTASTRIVCVSTIFESEDASVSCLCDAIATEVGVALDHIESSNSEAIIGGMDLQAINKEATE